MGLDLKGLFRTNDSVNPESKSSRGIPAERGMRETDTPNTRETAADLGSLKKKNLLETFPRPAFKHYFAHAFSAPSHHRDLHLAGL